VLHATVVDEKQRLITNLTRNAFQVFENGQPQPITSFRQEDVPVAMGIVIDNSGSMREKRDKVAKAAENLVASSNPQDQVFVVNFSDEYYLDQDFTNDPKKLRGALEKLESRGGTALYDAVVASADHLKKNAKLQKKVLFVVTDGEDDASRGSLEQSVRQLQEENGPTIYAIGILGDEKQRRARRALQTIAERTGGIAFLPKSVDEVDEISRTVAKDIRSILVAEVEIAGRNQPVASVISVRRDSVGPVLGVACAYRVSLPGTRPDQNIDRSAWWRRN